MKRKSRCGNPAVGAMWIAIIVGPCEWWGVKVSQMRFLIQEAYHDVIEEVQWKKPSKPSGVPVWSHCGKLFLAVILMNSG